MSKYRVESHDLNVNVGAIARVSGSFLFYKLAAPRSFFYDVSQTQLQRRYCSAPNRTQAWLTRAALGGGGDIPLPYFFDSSKTTADIAAKLSVPYPA